MNAHFKQSNMIRLVLFFCSILFFNVAYADNKYLNASNDIKAIETIIEIYRLDNSKYPSSLVEIEGRIGAVLKNNQLSKDMKLPVDPWGKKYIYIHPAKYGNRGFDLYSTGADTIDQKGAGDDVSNWNGLSNIPKEKLQDISFSSDELYFFGLLSGVLIIGVSIVLYKLYRRNSQNKIAA